MLSKEKVMKKRKIKIIYQVLSVLIAFISSVVLVYWNRQAALGVRYTRYVVLCVVGILYCIVYWFFVKMYYAQKIGLYRLTELAYFQFLSFGIADVVLMAALTIWFHKFQGTYIFSFILGFVVQNILICISIFVCNRFWAKNDEPRRVLIIYGREDYISFLKKIKSKKYRYHVMGCIEDSAPIETIKEAINASESIYLYEVNTSVRKELVLYCESVSRAIYITQDVENLVTRGFEVSHTFDTPFIRTKKIEVAWYYPWVKRTMDIVLSAAALIILSPVMIIAALLIHFYDNGPVFYKQVRLTKDHREFEIYKFRSMIPNAEKNRARLASQNDSRITPIGKVIRAARIDELPQFINILKGDMTIVGPRPERPEIEKKYLEELPEFGMRLKVKAGLTGYAQIFGKYNTTPEDKLKLDLLYINSRSLFMDFKIMFYTVKILFIPESTEGFREEQTTEMGGEKR